MATATDASSPGTLGDQGGTLHAAGIHLLHPAIRERFGCPRIVPPEFPAEIAWADLQVRRRALARECVEKGGQKKMAMRVVDHAIRR